MEDDKKSKKQSWSYYLLLQDDKDKFLQLLWDGVNHPNMKEDNMVDEHGRR